MGRELKRKEAKRRGKNVKEAQKKNSTKPITPRSFAWTMVGLVVLLTIVYILSGIFITKDIKWFEKKSTTTEEETVSIKNKILAAESLRQLDEEYYVYYYDTKDEDDEISDVVSALSETVYRVDLHDDFNTNFVGEPSGVVDSIDKLKVSNPTVIKVSSEQIVAFYSGEEIKNLK